jgi:hypothetical protein
MRPLIRTMFDTQLVAGGALEFACVAAAQAADI